MPNVGFILGAPKSATSSMVGMLNCHPHLLSLYEVMLYKPEVTKYGRHVLEEHPSWRPFFGARGGPVDNYRALARHLAQTAKAQEAGSYTYLFDKIPSLSTRRLHDLATDADAILYMVRDVRTWLVKPQIHRYYACREHAAPAVVDHVAHLIHSFAHVGDTLHHVNLSRFIDVDSPVPGEVADFLGIDLHPDMTQWWDRVEEAEAMDPYKRTLGWRRYHPSSSRAPTKRDTRTEISNHPFWDDVLPIFDRYYEHLNKPISPEQRNRDLNRLADIRTRAPIPVDDLFTDVDTMQFGVNDTGSTEMNLTGKVLFKLSVLTNDLAQRIGR